jgi:hypothetical protein
MVFITGKEGLNDVLAMQILVYEPKKLAKRQYIKLLPPCMKSYTGVGLSCSSGSYLQYG